MNKPETPMCDRLAAHDADRRLLVNFLEWLLNDQGCADDGCFCDINPEKAVFGFLEINEIQLEQERRALLEYQCLLNKLDPAVPAEGVFMTLLHNADEAALYRCTCGHEFWVDATTEENLYHNGKELLPECPKCGIREHKRSSG